MKRTISSEALSKKHQTKSIYYLEINNKYYIDKDVYIEQNRRIKDHLRDSKKNTHYNKYFQNAYYKYKSVKWGYLWKGNCTIEELFIKVISVLAQEVEFDIRNCINNGGKD